MDKEQEEMQFLGFFSIIKESFYIILAYRKLFSKITLSLILPLSFISLAQILISKIIFGNITNNNEDTPDTTQSYTKISDFISSEWTAYLLFKLACFIFALILSLFSTAAVAYTTASFFTAKTFTFKNVISVVPKVFKRLMITFLWILIINFAISLVVILVLALGFMTFGASSVGALLLLLFMIIFIIMVVYMSIIWHMANVISVLEDAYGIQALLKSKDLIKGKIGVSVAFVLLSVFCLTLILLQFEQHVVTGGSLGERIGFGFLLLVLHAALILLGLVIQTVIYFVCKSLHHENIDKSIPVEHLEINPGKYASLNSTQEPFDV